MNKRVTKAMDLLGNDTLKELEALSKEGLDKRIVDAEKAMREAADELEKNPEYENLRESLKALTAGKRELDKRQKAVILVALHLMEMKG